MTLAASGISKSFGNLKVLDHVSFSIGVGEFVSIVGPSGCGKSTLLNVLSRLEEPDEGAIEADEHPRIGYMMQDSLLLPWRTLKQNALLGTEVGKFARSDSERLIERYFEAFDLSSGMALYPDAASGGMKQRAALIRTLATHPRTLLLDEPFTSLDFDVKLRVQKLLVEYHERHMATTLVVTHDIDDAIALSDRVIVLSDKPSAVKDTITIKRDIGNRDPIGARKSARFSEYFARIWDEIKYLDKEEGPSETS